MSPQKGQTLIEVLVALGIAVVVLTAMGTAVISALNNAQFSKSQNLATHYAVEGMEVMRRIRDSDWTTFTGFSGDYCLPANSSTITLRSGSPRPQCLPPNIPPSFVREVLIQQAFPQCVTNSLPPRPGARVVVSVFWTDGSCAAASPYCHVARNESCFSNATVVPSP